MKKTMRERFHNNMFTDKMSYLMDITDCEIGKELLAKHLVCFKLVNEMDSNLSLFTKDKISKYLAFQLMDELSIKDFKFFIESGKVPSKLNCPNDKSVSNDKEPIL